METILVPNLKKLGFYSFFDNIKKDEANNLLDENEIYDIFSIAFAKNSLPYSLLEDKSFIQAVNLYKKYPEINFSKYKLKKRMLYVGEKVNNDIINKLSLDK